MAVLLEKPWGAPRVDAETSVHATSRLTLGIAGIGAWARGAPDWLILRALLRGEADWRDDAPGKPAAGILPPGERRRAPESVLLAAEVAGQACAAAGREAGSLPCVFASTQGELSITDYMCATLATAPQELSPTKFHNSVHNAPAGYWTIAAQCTAGSSAVTGYHASFGAGLLEAVALAIADDTPVLFAAYDIGASGPLMEMARATRAFGVAVVLTPGGDALPRISIATRNADAAVTPAPACVAELARDNPLNAHALAFLAAVAGAASPCLTLPAASGLILDMEVHS
ncbi:MAG TPA: beta-ketoacyl synthase chain length factor [Rhodanobacteraceae bacterium]|nr:beta-ketoacyl synthase chain length factor [Rhodanobacteraceae bacterium]